MAREHIADRRLPVIFPRSMNGGYGSGTTCCLCELRIEQHQVEYEVTDDQTGRVLSFHLACQAIWQLECRAWIMARDGAVT